MKRLCLLSLALALPACTGDDSTAVNVVDASPLDTSVADVAPRQDAESLVDAGSAPDTGATADAGDASNDAAVELDAADGACPGSWLEAPSVDVSIAVPDGGGGVLLHATGTGTQNYVCAPTTADSGPAYLWTLVTPEATLTDCHDVAIGRHFASEAGVGFPEWQTNDGTYVVGQKHLPTFTPDGGSGSIPWLLLRAVDAGGGSGVLSSAAYVQRLDTDGGNAPSTTCDVGSVNQTAQVPYTAEYFFYGP